MYEPLQSKFRTNKIDKSFMMQFETYENLIEYLKGHTDLCMTLKYLEEGIKDEEKFLHKDIKRKNSTITWTDAERKNKMQAVTNGAREGFLNEINKYLRSNNDLTSMCIIGYRFRHIAWAIANNIKEYQVWQTKQLHL